MTYRIGPALLALTLSAVLLACGGHAGQTVTTPGARADLQDAALPPADAAEPFDLRRPSAVAETFPPQNPQAFYYGRYFYGAYAVQQGLAQRVTAAEEVAEFTPDWRGGAGEAAYAVFGCNMQYYEGSGTFNLEWDGDPPAAGNLYVGLGNFETNGWDWFTPDGTLTIDDPAPYISEIDFLLAAVVVLGDAPARLAGLRIGEEVVVEDVDLPMLFAPVLDWEIAVQADDFAARDPVARDFTVVEQANAGGFDYDIVSYTVDGLTIYGGVRLPAATEPGSCPVMLYGHCGAAGATIYGTTWLRSIIGDDELFDQFILLIAISRGEVLAGGSVQYWADGDIAYYDRDADDALALLDCVLANYPQADPERVCAVGWSRGAQVVTRAATRDPRITGVIAFALWTDEWSLDGQGSAYDALPQLTSEPTNRADMMYEYYHCLWELKNGDCAIWDMRQLMLHMSVAYSADDLPAIQLHAGSEDPLNAERHSGYLASWLSWYGHTDYRFWVYEDGTHDPSSYSGAGPRVRELLTEYVE
ncbi:hypothetical protein JW859_04735 [bacterium]|nr:hypothetical protein [bacterium]